MALPMPDFFEPNSVSDLYLERTALVEEEATRYRHQYSIAPAEQDTYKIAAFGIDCQVGFCTPGASLFVPGAVEDMQRTLAWLYSNLDKLTDLYFTLDTHSVFQIFHPAWWVDRDGQHPPPFTPITYREVKNGTWTPVAYRHECLEYCQKLETNSKYILTIWPYHVLLGGISHTLVPALMEASLFHCMVRQQQTVFVMKGSHALTEHFSVLSPEVQELGGQLVGGFNDALFKSLMEYDRVYVFGQAKSHCVRATLYDIRDRIEATEPELMDRVWILQDAMSPVPPPSLVPLPPELDYARLADETLREMAQVGMHIVNTGDLIAL
ncbi:MAG: nicotinamidase [bacterium]|nr:nicotinamidase [bacterium]